MKKRLRKKKHLKEFRDIYFEIKGQFANTASEMDVDKFVATLIDIVERHDCGCCGFAGWDNRNKFHYTIGFPNDHHVTRIGEKVKFGCVNDIYNFLDKNKELKFITDFKFNGFFDAWYLNKLSVDIQSCINVAITLNNVHNHLKEELQKEQE